MKNLLFAILGSIVVLASCSRKKSVPADIEKFAGEWEVVVYELPKVGDKVLHTLFIPKDSVLTGYFTEDNGGRTEFSEIIIDGNKMKVKYDWGGHKTSYKVEMNDSTPNAFEGKMFGFFKVKGIRKKK
ncbi:hypothetical protein E9993_00235 [Labilibacter sediminis]|nr:hypothetical protein E9993_00235 [Labilibacter sediminis]